MRIPGFTASSSLYRSTVRYQTQTGPPQAPAAVHAAGGLITRDCVCLPPERGSGCGETQQGGGGGCALPGVMLQTDCSAGDIIAKFARCRRNGCRNSTYNAGTCVVTCA